MKKKCTKCRKTQPLSEFYKNGKYRNNSCRLCYNTYMRKLNKTSRSIKRRREYSSRPEVKKRNRESAKKPERIKITRERINNKLRNDPKFKLTYTLRRRLHHMLKLLNIAKSDRTLHLVGCEIDYLLYYIQNQFKRGMNWDNHSYEGWHLDHIIPCSYFDLRKSKEQRKCFHYTNLRPLWSRDNLIKNNKLPKDFDRRVWTDEGWIVE